MNVGNPDRRTARTKAVATTVLIGCGALGLLALAAACGSTATVFNSAFLNELYGGQVPVTPGPGAAFVLVRALNETDQAVEFIVTIEREVLVPDENGDFQQDDQGNWVTLPLRETLSLDTSATSQASQGGVLFPCSPSPVTVVGLGEDLQPTDAAVFVGGAGAGGAAGFGVPAGSLNPLQWSAGNFDCGDTIIYRAFLSSGVVGGIGLQVYLLPGSEQPDIFNGPDTFVNLANYLDTLVPVDEGP